MTDKDLENYRLYPLFTPHLHRIQKHPDVVATSVLFENGECTIRVMVDDIIRAFENNIQNILAPPIITAPDGKKLRTFVQVDGPAKP